MPQAGTWGFQQQPPPMPPPMQQPFIGNQGMMPSILGNNVFQNQPPPFIPNQQNLMQHQQVFTRFRPPPPPLPPQPSSNPNLFNLNINRPPPPPPEVIASPPALLSNTGPNTSNQFDKHRDETTWKRPQLPENNDNQTLSDQEQQFDVMFAAWEEGFDSWKRDNQNNPDQVDY